MKRWIAAMSTAALLAVALLLPGTAQGEAVMNQLRNMRKNAGDRIVEMEPIPSVEPTPSPAPEAAEPADYEPLESGVKGEAVLALQTRLIELGYLSGKADGSYGSKTASAVRAFQQAAELEATGIADEATQRRLFAGDAPISLTWEKFDYRKAVGSAEDYRGHHVTLSGTVLQALENDACADSLGTIYTVMRLALKNDYSNVVYVAWFRDRDATAPAEGDEVSVQGLTEGLYSYRNEADTDVTLPRIAAERVE